MTAAEKLQKYLNGDKLNVRYTLQTDDITCGEAPFGMPYRDRKGYFDASGYCKEARAQLTVSEYNGGLKIELATSAENLSEFGLSFPFNFMGKKNGGGWSNQYLLNSPYSSVGNDFKYCYLTNPNGKNLIVFPKGIATVGNVIILRNFAPVIFFLNWNFWRILTGHTKREVVAAIWNCICSRPTVLKAQSTRFAERSAFLL